MRTLVIVALALIFFVHGLGAVSLWDPDEPRQAVMAREMMERSDYVHPYLNGQLYLEKPPLYSWLIILTAKITGSLNEFSSRLPSALAAMFLLLVTYFLGRRLDHEVSGFLSALILALNYQFLSNARESVMDMTFAFFIGLSIFLSYLCVEKERRWLLPFALLPSACAILTKGPAGLVIPVAVIFFYAVATKRLRAVFTPLVVGSILSLAIASIWFILAGKASADEFLLRQNITRYVTGFDHIETYWYYFHKLLVNFLPWSIALPFAAVFAYRRRLWLPLIWLVFTFLFFEVSKSKRAIYLLSCYPACAILVGIFLKERWYALVERRWTTFILCLFGLALVAVPALIFPAMWRVPLVRQIFGSDTTFPAMVVVVLGASSLAFLASIIRKAPEQGFLALFIYLGFLGFLYHSHYMPAMDRTQKSMRLITEAMPDTNHSASIYTYHFSSSALIFYTGRPIKALKDPSEIPEKKDDIIVIAEDKKNRADPFKQMFPYSKTVQYERERYLIFAGQDGTYH
jgi:4-amino-4-deoxy-L-arabinose transferase-like glycosyltransferase